MEFIIPYLLPYLFSFSDVTLTFYQFFLMKKKGVENHKLELNPIVRYLFKGGPSPLKYVIAITYTYSIMFILFWLLGKSGNVYNLIWCCGVASGMLLIPNIYHITNIKRYKQFWHDERYWEITKIIK